MMIKNYENWKVFENLGNGEETFDQKLDMYGQMKNLDIVGFKDEWGELEDAKGEMTYKAILNVKNNGIDDISFMLSSVDIVLGIRKYKDDNDEDGVEEEIKLTIDIRLIEFDNVAYEINQLPYYLDNLELDLSDVEDLSVPEQLKKIKYEFVIGSQKN